MAISYSFKVVFFLAISVVMLLSVFGNISVVISFLKTQNIRTSTNYYITSMAVSDVLYVTTDWTLYSSSRLSVFSNSLSSFGCKLGKYCTHVSYSVSIFSLVLITVDRFIATVFPLKVTMITKRIRAIFILLSWLLPTGILSPQLYSSKLAEEPDKPYICVSGMSHLASTSYQAVGFVLLYCAPLVAIIIFNVGIVKSLKGTNPVIQRNSYSNTQRRKQNRQIMKLLISIDVFFSSAGLQPMSIDPF